MFGITRFKSGDVVRANFVAPYKITKEGWLGRVVQVYPKDHPMREIGQMFGFDNDLQVMGPGLDAPVDVSSSFFDKMPEGTTIPSEADLEVKRYEDKEMECINKKMDAIWKNTEEIKAMLQKPKKGRGRPRKNDLIL